MNNGDSVSRTQSAREHLRSAGTQTQKNSSPAGEQAGRADSVRTRWKRLVDIIDR